MLGLHFFGSARRSVHLFSVLTNAERFSVGTELDKLPTNGKDNTLERLLFPL
jgi:hypothetical protein